MNNELNLNPQAISNGSPAVMMASEQSRAIAEIQASLLIAKTYPRNEIACTQKIMIACQRKKLAEKAIYQYARGGTSIEGASIRLAEVIANSWGNIDYGYRVLESNKERSLVEAFAWDKETNAKRNMVFEASHYRGTKKGKILLTDDRDIYEIVANLASRRIRACILSIVPFDIQEEALEECKKTLITKANMTDQRKKDMLKAFESFGVTKSMIEKRIQRKLEALEPAQFINLGNIYNSLKDGISVVADWFEADEEVTTLDLSVNKDTPPQTTPPESSEDKKLTKAQVKKMWLDLGATLEDAQQFVGENYEFWKSTHVEQLLAEIDLIQSSAQISEAMEQTNVQS